jgi:DNA-binding transcriptional regulator YiaG
MVAPKRDFHSPDPRDQFAGDLAATRERLGAVGDLAATVDVRAIRKRMGVTQRQFAGWFGFSVATLRHWERGNRKPAGTALVLLHVIRDNPHVVLQAVRKARLVSSRDFPPIEPLESYRHPPGFGGLYRGWKE